MQNFMFKSKYAFTLAEVLITLVVIGVIAALTISPLINTYVESSTVSKVKKTLSILGQAKKLAEVQNGSIEGWNFNAGYTFQNVSDFWNYLKPHITVSKDCGNSTGCYDVDVYKLNGSPNDTSYNSSFFYKIILTDGSVLWFRPTYSDKCRSTEGGVENVCAAFYYDVNGEKKPNTIAKDVFIFYMSADGVFPSLSDTCSKSSTGWGCTSYIIKNNNMNYLH